MKHRAFSQLIGIDPRIAATNIVLVAGAFIWYFLAFSILTDLLDLANATSFETLVVQGVNVGAIAITAIIGSLLVEKYKKRVHFLYFWMFVGILISFTTIMFTPSTYSEIIAVSLVFGGYFGIGMPAALGYFSASTEIKNRARLSGFTFLVIGLFFFVLGSLSVGSIVIAGVVLLAFRIVTLLLFYLSKKNDGVVQNSSQVSYFRIMAKRSFLLFLIPWLVFNLVDYLTMPFITRLTEGTAFYQNVSLYQNILIAVVAVTIGFIADFKGRKCLMIVGFASLGVGYAALGLFQGNFVWYIFFIADGISWGIFNVLFLFTLWGDLAQGYNSEKMYVLGALPYLFSNFVRLLLSPLLSGFEPTTLFSFASFLLFVAVLPLIYSPETLPEKTIKEMEIKSYLDKAQKIALKQSEKYKKQEKPKPQKHNSESIEEKTENNKDYEEAKKLAEKYY